MKCKVKGLVFVGFAAAILAGAAHAAPGDEHVVTSKAYTDATYEKLDDKVQTTDGLTAEQKAVKYPSVAALEAAITSVENGASDAYEVKANKLAGGATGTGSIADNANDATKYTSAKAVADYVTAQLSSGGADNSGYEEKANKASAIVTDSSASGYNATSTIEYASTKAVVDYVQDKLTGAQNGIITQNITDGDTTHAPSGDAVHDALANKQAIAPSNDEAQVGYNGSWYKIDGFGYTKKAVDGVAKAVTITLDNEKITSGTADITDIDGSDNDENIKLTRAIDVKNAIDALAGDTATDLSGKQDNLGGTGMGGKVVTASETAGTVTYTSIDTAVTSGSNNLVTSDAVYDALNDTTNGHVVYQAYSTTENQISDGAGGWKNLDSDIATNGSSASAPTTAAVKTYVDNQIQAQPAYSIPAKNSAVCTAALPCALVAEGDYLNWRVMAVSEGQTTAAGTCGNVGGTCNTGNANP